MDEPGSAIVKDEVTTPRPHVEAGDTIADESAPGRHKASRFAKRKRDEDSPTPMQPSAEHEQPPEEPDEGKKPVEGEVLWTRAFNKVSGSAMEQIIHHRTGSMFSVPIRDRDAPGYHKVILQPQDLKSIRVAINHGNRAAAQVAASLPGGDPGDKTLYLPTTEELKPPKGIVNSSQLDRELAHMFANAIMYNPDPGHGPGPSFLHNLDEVQGDGEEGGEHVLGYKVDEFGVVNDTRAMFVEVEKLLSELRSAEVRKGARPGATTGTSTRQASVAAGNARDVSMSHDEGSSFVKEEAADERQTPAAEAEAVGNAVKRRRTTRG